MLNNSSALKVTLEISQETNLNELMAHLCLMQNNIPTEHLCVSTDNLLSDFSIHEGELGPVE